MNKKIFRDFKFWILIISIILIIIGAVSYSLEVKYEPCPLFIGGEIAIENCDSPPPFWMPFVQIGAIFGQIGQLLLVIGIVFYIAFYINKTIKKH